MNDVNDDRGESEIPWQPPVIAAIIGALLVAAFVIYAIVTGPVDEPGEEEIFAPAVPSKDLPSGYTSVLDDLDVGIRVESMTREGGFSTVVVSSAVNGTTDPAVSSPPDVAYWELGPEGARVTMDTQFASGDAPGTTTIVFPAEVVPSEAFVVAHPTTGTVSVGRDVEVSPDMIGEPIAFVLDIEDGTTITGQVTVGDGWGTVEWNSEPGVFSTLDVGVTFVGTQNAAADNFEPIRLVPTYDPSLARPGTVITQRPLFGLGGLYGLYGDGRSLTEGVEPTSIVITLEGTVVTATGAAVVLDPPVPQG